MREGRETAEDAAVGSLMRSLSELLLCCLDRELCVADADPRRLSTSTTGKDV